MLTLGSPAPGFTLPDQIGKPHSLRDVKGRWVLVYFYPKDDTPGCTKEACAIRDSMKAYDEAKCTVFGISRDSAESHKAFADKYSLPFTLLSDTEGSVIEAYGAGKDGSSGVKRISVLVDPTGKVSKIYYSVTPDEHAGEVLSDITLFQRSRNAA